MLMSGCCLSFKFVGLKVLEAWKGSGRGDLHCFTPQSQAEGKAIRGAHLKS